MATVTILASRHLKLFTELQGISHAVQAEPVWYVWGVQVPFLALKAQVIT